MLKPGANERGAVVVLVAVMLVVIFVCTALVVDIGHVHNVKAEMQRAVDAAALAAAARTDLGEAVVDNAAIAVGAANSADNQPVVILPENVVIGSWKPLEDSAPGETAATRFTAGGTPGKAVRVSATRAVEHAFFFFTDSTLVDVDAIAVNKYEEKVLPIALVTCIPTGGGPTMIAPGENVCDIVTFTFGPDMDDTAGWTSLTFPPASAPNIRQFLTKDGSTLFNQVVHGTGMTHDGLEGEPVVKTSPIPPDPKDPAGCESNVNLSIDCGLGGDFTSPATLPADPLSYDPLPRWFNDNDFNHIVTMGGDLAPTATQAQLQALYESGDPKWQRFIRLQGGTYKPRYGEVLKVAGYPPVYVNNGDIPNALNDFFDQILGPDGETFQAGLQNDNEPFDAANAATSGGQGNTVKLTMPIIYAGACEDWKSISNSGTSKLYYVGLANLLVTRAYKNPNCFECGDTAVVRVGSPCSPFNPDPPLDGSQYGCTSITNKVKPAAIEGLLKLPAGEEEESGGVKVFLVE